MTNHTLAGTKEHAFVSSMVECAQTVVGREQTVMGREQTVVGFVAILAPNMHLCP